MFNKLTLNKSENRKQTYGVYVFTTVYFTVNFLGILNQCF